MDAIILAGGKGTRLQSVVSDVPKPLAPVNNRPFLDIILNFLSKCNCVSNVIIAVGYMADKVIREYQNRREFSFNILFSIEENLLGTGGAIKKALQYAETNNVLALNGDSFINFNINKLILNHKKNNADMTIVLKKIADISRYGRVKLNNNKRIIAFEEKTVKIIEGYINTGVYIFKKQLFDNVEKNKIISLEKELLPFFLEKMVYGCITNGKFIDIGVPESYRMSNKFFNEMNLQ